MKKLILFPFFSFFLIIACFGQNIITNATWKASNPVPISIVDEFPLTSFNNINADQDAMEYYHPKFSNIIWAKTLYKDNKIGIKCYLTKTFTVNNSCPVELRLTADNHCRLYVNNKLYINGAGYSSDLGTNGTLLKKLSISTPTTVWNAEVFTINNLVIGQNTILLEGFDTGWPSNNFAGVSVEFNINNNKPLQIFATANQKSICQGKKTTLTAFGGVTYLWNNGEKTETIEVNPDSTTIYTVVGTDASGCKSGTASVTVNVNKSIGKEITILPQNCAATIQLSAAESQNYLWNTGEITKTIKVKEGNYFLTITDNDGCKKTSNITVPPFVKPTVSLAADLTITPGEKTQLIATSSVVPLTISWFPKDKLSCDNCLNPFVKNYESRTYKVIINDIYGCEASDDIKVKVVRNVFVPNAFSPNGDNINDLFSLRFGKGVNAVHSLLIYDRWGELIHETDNNVWDGTFRGKEAPQGIYTFIARVIYEDDIIESFSGDLTLLR